MAKQWRRASSQKRGGGLAHAPMDTQFAESRYAIDATVKQNPDEVFDRQWALTLLDLTLKRLQGEFAGSKPQDFDILKGTLMAAHGGIDYAAIASELGVSPGAARVEYTGCANAFGKFTGRKLPKPWLKGPTSTGNCAISPPRWPRNIHEHFV